MNQITFQSVYQTSATSNPFKLGQRGQTPDGRQWVFVKANSALAKGSVAVPDAVTAVDLVSSSADGLGRIVYITKAAAGWTTGQFEDAIGVVDDGTGVGQTFKIQTNSTDTLTLYPETALSTALSVADSDITIRTMAEVDKAAITSALQSAVGAAQVAFAAGDYGWLLTEGDGVVLAGNSLVVGAGFTTGDDTTGQVIVSVITEAPLTAQNLGICLVANAAADQGTLVRFFIR
jgi:hypothetical protein